MTVQNSVSRDDETLKSLAISKTQIVTVLSLSHELKGKGILVPQIALLPASQLDYALDNMIRLHLLGTVPSEMHEKFKDQVKIMDGQCTSICAQILKSLSDDDRTKFESKLSGYQITDEMVFAGAALQLKTDFRLDLVLGNGEVQLIPIGDGA